MDIACKFVGGSIFRKIQKLFNCGEALLALELKLLKSIDYNLFYPTAHEIARSLLHTEVMIFEKLDKVIYKMHENAVFNS